MLQKDLLFEHKTIIDNVILPLIIVKADKKKVNFEKKMELINILSKMNNDQVNFIKNRLGIEHKSKSNENLENDFTNDFVNIFDILEIYNFID